MAIGASIKKAVSKVVSSVKSAFSSGSQGASAMNFPVGKGLTPAQTATANKTLGISNTTTGGLTYNTNQAGQIQNTKFGTTPTLNVQKALKTGGLTLDPVGRVVTPIKVSKASSPSSVTGINTSVPSMTLSSSQASTPSTTNTTAGLGSAGAIAPAVAAVAGLDAKTKGQQSLAELQLANEQKKQADSNWLKDMLDKRKAEPDIAQQRADLERQYGIQEKTNEINSLTQSLGQVEAEVASQVAKTQDIMGSNNFINNQIAQINRNSAPTINKLRADINFKTGILTQNKELVAQALSDATATSRQKWEDFKWFRNENQEIEKYISPELKRALDLQDKQLEWQHQEDVQLHKWKLDMAEKYAEAGVQINDSKATILEKIGASGGGSSSGFMDVMQEAINAGATPEQAAREAAAVSEGTGIQVDQKVLNSWVSQAKRLKPIKQDVVQPSPVPTTQSKSFFGNYGTRPGEFRLIDKISSFLFK